MTWQHTDTAGQTIRITDDRGVHVSLVISGRRGAIICIPSDQRQGAAQAVAGDDYRVVPANVRHGCQWTDDPYEPCPVCGQKLPEWERELLAREAKQPDRPEYPYADGDTLVLGPATFIDWPDQTTICHKGDNYVRQPDRREPVDPASMAAAKAEALREFASGLDSEFDHIKVALCDAADRYERPEPDPQVVAALIPIVQKVCMVEPHHAEQFARDLARHDVYVEVSTDD